MIITEYPYVDEYGIEHYNFIKIYSDLNVQIKQIETDRIFDNVIDLYPNKYGYVETNIPLEEI